MLISCLMPTFNRYPALGWLVEEAVESFLRQDLPEEERELVICNDAAGQILIFRHPRVRVLNVSNRFPTLSAKLQYMIDQSPRATHFTRWDDDDISLPHRLSLSVEKLLAQERPLEWRPENYWWDTGTLEEKTHQGNTHVMSLWQRGALMLMGDRYPEGKSGIEDQAFNGALARAGFPGSGENLRPEEIFYLYRWATGSSHLSGAGGGPPDNPHQAHYDQIGTRPIHAGQWVIRPRWYRNHCARAAFACNAPTEPTAWESIGGYFDFAALYDRVVAEAPGGSTLVEVGCLHGKSLCYLGLKAKEARKRLRVVGVDLGVGVAHDQLEHVPMVDTSTLIGNVRKAGLSDIVKVIAAESTAAAELFADGSLYFVMLDDAHDYHSVRAGVQAWGPKIELGGIYAGHDYERADFGVKRAVDEFFAATCGDSHGTGVMTSIPSCWAKRRMSRDQGPCAEWLILPPGWPHQ